MHAASGTAFAPSAAVLDVGNTTSVTAFCMMTEGYGWLSGFHAFLTTLDFSLYELAQSASFAVGNWVYDGLVLDIIDEGLFE